MTTDVEKRIVKQMEYYFGDCNLPRDRFLQEQIKENDGWVALETMMKCNRLKQICDDVNAVGEALKKSESDLLEMSVDGLKVRRNPEKPLPENNEESRKEQAARTVYAKGLPLDATLDDVQEFFETFGDVDNVFMRKDGGKKFKGSVFVTFKSEESAKKFLEPESLKYKENDLEKRMKKDEYFSQKAEEKKKVKEEKQAKKGQATDRQRTDEDKKIENEMVEGALLQFDNIVVGTAREDIRNKLQDYAPIAWIDYNKGDVNCVIRYEQVNQARDVLKKLLEDTNNEIEFNGGVVGYKVLEGEEAFARWKKMHQERTERQNKRMNSKNFKKGKWGKRPSKATREAMRYVAQAEHEAKAAARADGEPPNKKPKM